MSEIEETKSPAVEQPVEVKQTMDVTEIMAILPHRYPFLLIDRIVEREPRKRLVAIKNVTATEPHFQGHFPGYPIMPGVLIVEAMAQAGGALLMPEFPNRDELLMLFTSIENAKFRRPVVPGDQLRLEVKILNWRRMAVKLLGIATVDGKVVCEATLMCMLIDNPAKQGGNPAKQGAAKQAPAKASEIAAAKEEKPAEAAPVPEAVLS
jgi:3-hydroxyacyl-[acyl-carrier-protein] dehydratase